MKILLLNWRDPKNPKAGGAEIVTHLYTKAWIAAGDEVTWLSNTFPGSSKKEIIDGVTIIRKGNALTAFFLFPFYCLFSGTHFDMVIDEVHGLPFLTPMYVKKPIIGFIHEVAGDIWDVMYPFPLSLIGRILEKLFFIPYAHIPFITVSNSTKIDLIGMGIQEENIHVLQNGLSNSVLSSLPAKNKNPTFLFVSRLVRMKGVEDIIRSFYSIQQKIPHSQLIIVGMGDKAYMNQLEMLVSNLGISEKVRFKGYVSQKEKLAIMAKSHILLHASIKEGWGLVVAEAASQGTPSIVYDTGGLRDVVKHNKTGIILKDNSPEEMAKEALLLIENVKKYAIFQKQCLEMAKSLQWKTSIDKSLTLLEKYS